VGREPGKFDSAEALETGYLELENAYHENTQKISELSEAVSTLVQNSKAQGGEGGGNSSDYLPPDPNAGSGVDANSFWANPQGVLDQRDLKIKREVVGVLADTLGSYFDTQDWKSSNPTLLKHERIVMSFLNETDKSKPMKDRLTVATQKTREYLKSIGIGDTTDAGGPPANTQIIEGPTGRQVVASPLPAGAPGGPGTEVLTDQTRLSTLNEFIKERLNQRVKVMG